MTSLVDQATDSRENRQDAEEKRERELKIQCTCREQKGEETIMYTV
jgi:hypothetical protein